MFILLGWIFIWFGGTYGQIDLRHCRHPLGMGDKRIKDEQVSASSSHAEGTGPKYARLERDEGDGAWCPLGVVRPNSPHWLQIELPTSSYISIIATQGRNGGGRGREFTPNYKLNYSRDGLNWLQWKSYSGETILKGNVDHQGIKRRLLSPGIASTAYIRFIPVTKSSKSVCARIEVYGCPMETSILQYNIPTPDLGSLPNNWIFDDETYDGRRESKTYHGGLGQLTDGVKGSTDILQTNSQVSTRIKGFDYVGWRNDVEQHRFVNMTFFFGDVRNFTAMKIHCVANADIGASLFSSIEVSFSLDGRSFPDSPHAPKARYDVPSSDGERVVVVTLKNAIARYVRARFGIRGEWMLVSEVEFLDSKAPKDWMKKFIRREDNVRTPATIAKALATIATPVPKKFENVAVIACALAGVIVLLASIVVFLAWRQRRLKKILTPPRYTYSARSGSTPNVTLCVTNQRSTFNTTACELPHKNASFQDVTTRRAIATPHEYSDPQDALSRGDYKLNPPDVTLCGSDVRNGVVPIPHYAETSISNLPPPPYATPPPSTSGGPSSTHLKSRLPKYSSPSESSTLLAEESSDDIGFCSELLDHCEECGVIEFPRQRLRFVDKLGEGQFGEVQLCQADPILRIYAQQNGIILSGDDGDPALVAVKLLRGDASPNTREDFLKEVKIMSRMRDPNIVQLLAVCVEEEPYALVTEYMANGDLNRYLKRFQFGDIFSDVPEPSSILHYNERVDCDVAADGTMSRTILLGIATQIAAGMKYLASLNFVHRDLATRNCLVGAGLNIRISDFGLSRNMYQTDYYRMEGKAILPIRWMPWESVLMGKFSTASDVWAFGVTVWEVFTLCRKQPFQDLSDPEVIDNMNQFYDDTGRETYLEKPDNCPEKVYQVLIRCWRRDAEARPKFNQLYSFFKKKV